MHITQNENGLFLDIEVTEDGDVRLLNLSSAPWEPTVDTAAFRLVELQGSSMDQDGSSGSKRTDLQPGGLLRYHSHTLSHTSHGSLLELCQKGGGLDVVSGFLFFDGIPVIRTRTVVTNESQKVHSLEYISSFLLTGLSKDCPSPPNAYGRLHIPYKTRHSDALLPMGSYENTALNRTYTWQIENAASWSWEVGQREGQLYLHLSGPSYKGSGFRHMLEPGKAFISATCAIACVTGGLGESIEALTRYRWEIR